MFQFFYFSYSPISPFSSHLFRSFHTIFSNFPFLHIIIVYVGTMKRFHTQIQVRSCLYFLCCLQLLLSGNAHARVRPEFGSRPGSESIHALKGCCSLGVEWRCYSPLCTRALVCVGRREEDRHQQGLAHAHVKALRWVDRQGSLCRPAKIIVKFPTRCTWFKL